MTPEEEAALIAYLLRQAGIDPASMQLSMGSAPLEPSSDQKRGLDFRQDYNQLLADPFTGAQAGPGAFDYSTFQPTIEEEEVQREGERLLQYYKSRNDGTWEKIIADTIEAGGGASTAFATIQQLLTGTPTTTEEAEIQATLQASIPQKMDFTTGEELGPDLEIIFKTAQDLEQKIALDPIGDRRDEATGKWYNQTVIPSEAAEKFRELGLPTPDERYDWRKLTGAAPDAVDPLSASRAEFSQGQLAELLQNVERTTRGNVAPVRQPTPTGTPTSPRGDVRMPDMSNLAMFRSQLDGIFNGREGGRVEDDGGGDWLGNISGGGLLGAIGGIPGKVADAGQWLGDDMRALDRRLGTSGIGSRIGGDMVAAANRLGLGDQADWMRDDFTALIDSARGSARAGSGRTPGRTDGGPRAGGGRQPGRAPDTGNADMKAIEAYKRALAAHNSQTAGSREAYARARADADRASERGQTPLIDALMARRMQGLLTGR